MMFLFCMIINFFLAICGFLCFMFFFVFRLAAFAFEKLVLRGSDLAKRHEIILLGQLCAHPPAAGVCPDVPEAHSLALRPADYRLHAPQLPNGFNRSARARVRRVAVILLEKGRQWVVSSGFLGEILALKQILEDWRLVKPQTKPKIQPPT